MERTCACSPGSIIGSSVATPHFPPLARCTFPEGMGWLDMSSLYPHDCHGGWRVECDSCKKVTMHKCWQRSEFKDETKATWGDRGAMCYACQG